jgi:hypothetical protein
MRSTRVRVPRALHEREAPFVEDVQEAAKPRMQAERLSRGVGADLQHLACWHCKRRATAVVRRVAIRHERVQRIVATAKVDDDEVTCTDTLCLGDRGQERGRGNSERDRRNAVADEESSRKVHDAF